MSLTLADIFGQHGSAYQQQFAQQLLPSHRQAIRAIVNCRTAALGGHVYTCPHCGLRDYRYHSCRNRHCPQCQQQAGEQWLVKQRKQLLPLPYFLLTFTLPSELRPLARQQQRLIYNLLFRTSAAAAQQLAQDKRFVGGQLGFMGVLHTWGRNLSYHPHVHYLVPGVGLDQNDTIRRVRNGFLMHVKPLGKLFRAKFQAALKARGLLSQIPTTAWQKDWVVHAKPVGRGVTALKYLAPYIFRVALSNNRLLSLTADHVTFRYRATETGKLKRCCLTITEFMRRFLQHVLPRGFVKVRYYGWLAPGKRLILRQLQLQLTAPEPPSKETPDNQLPTSQAEKRCPYCDQLMLARRLPRPRGRCPPPLTSQP